MEKAALEKVEPPETSATEEDSEAHTEEDSEAHMETMEGAK